MKITHKSKCKQNKKYLKENVLTEVAIWLANKVMFEIMRQREKKEIWTIEGDMEDKVRDTMCTTRIQDQEWEEEWGFGIRSLTCASVYMNSEFCDSKMTEDAGFSEKRDKCPSTSK